MEDKIKSLLKGFLNNLFNTSLESRVGLLNTGSYERRRTDLGEIGARFHRRYIEAISSINPRAHLILDSRVIHLAPRSPAGLMTAAWTLEQYYEQIRIDADTLNAFVQNPGHVALLEILNDDLNDAKYGEDRPFIISPSGPSHKDALKVLLLGNSTCGRADKIKAELSRGGGTPLEIHGVPDRYVRLTDFPRYWRFDAIISNWNQYAFLLRRFIEDNPSYARALLVLYSGILELGEYNFENIVDYGIFDFVITFELSKSHTWEMVSEELGKNRDERRHPCLGKKLRPLDYLGYAWGDVEIQPTRHYRIHLKYDEIADWSHAKEYNLIFESRIVQWFEENWTHSLRQRGGTMEADPIWGRPRLERDKPFCFVLTPFSEPFDIIFRDHIVPAVEGMGLECVRASDYYTTTAVMGDVWNAINNAEIIVAELTGRNPNVFYELGIAHTLGKQVIMISQREEDIPFDLRHLRYYLYEYTPRGCSLLMDNIRNVIENILGGKDRAGRV